MPASRKLLALLLLVGCGGDDSPASGEGAGDAESSTGSTVDADSTGDSASATRGSGDGSASTGAIACEADTPEYERIDVGEVTLNVARFGCGRPLVFLHGFPEFSFSWEVVTTALASDYAIVAPDQRGFNLSDIPPQVGDYRIDRLAADIVGLIDATTSEPPVLIGHDWGGAVAWMVAHEYPERLAGLVILNAPHPDVFARELADNPAQVEATQYMNFFVSRGAEAVLSAGDYGALLAAFEGALTDEQVARYQDAYAIEGALTGMLGWYRANIDEGPTPGPDWPAGVTVDVPTLVMWGMDDTALLPSNLDGLEDYVADLRKVEIDGATHWVVHEDSERVTTEIRTFVESL